MVAAINWRILIDLIVRIYEDWFKKDEPPIPVPPPPNPPPPEPPPVPPPDEGFKDYVHMSTVARKVVWIDQNLHIWAGVRDINFVLSNCDWAFYAPTRYFDSTELRLTAQEYMNTINEGEALKKRLPKRHPTYTKRSRVRKAVWRDFEVRVKALNARVEGYRQFVQSWPQAAGNFDSIAGWCQYCNANGIRTPE